jgi:polygalacturonase
MKNILTSLLICFFSFSVSAQDVFPDGTPISDWFYKTTETDINKLGKHYRVTEYEVRQDSTILQTEKIQAVIDKAYQAGGGVIIIPKGTYLSGALFFKTGTHLHLEEGGVLKGSDDISHFPLLMTRIEGQTLKYFSALINVDKVDGFTLSGNGCINGNGLRYWKAFWLRRQFNPKCTNMDEMRPRLIYISESKNVQLSGVKLMNSPFWTTHLYKCEYAKLLNLNITSPFSPIKAPSTDAIDLDVCNHILVKGCYMSVNDDAIALKGGKGPFAHEDENNGKNYNIIIEDCEYGICHSALTCGSESIHTYNVILRNSKVNKIHRLLQLKMRPDTHQRYENISIENITGTAERMIDVKPWTQFFNLQGKNDICLSYANDIKMKNIQLECQTVFDIVQSDQYQLSNFTFSDMTIKTERISDQGTDMIKNLTTTNLKINDRVFTGETQTKQ